MRCATPGYRRGVVVAVFERGEFRAIADDDGRSRVPITQLRPQASKLPSFLSDDKIAHFCSNFSAALRILLHMRPDQRFTPYSIIVGRTLNNEVRDFATFHRVRLEQTRAAPSIQRRRDLPPEIRRIANTEIHAKTTEW